jgi:RHS repeat-associated protein
MGNITGLSRTGIYNQALVYNYNGNQLTSIINSGTAFRSYGYDANGNATSDGQGHVITYNMLNLPQSIPTKNLSYTYDANGRKLRKVSGTNATDYIDGIQYDNNNITFIQTEEGRAINSGGNYSYEYSLQDHLGNTRLNFDQNGTTRQQDDYYPFGMEISKGTVSSPKNEYLYNRKELQEELTQYDYGARFYDPVIGRWTTPDPMAEKREWLSGYNYVQNNPIIRIDPDGAFDWVKGENGYVWDDRVVDQKTATEYQGDNAKYVGKEATVYSMKDGNAVDATKLNSDGSVTANGSTLGVNSNSTVTNAAGSEFTPRQTIGHYAGVSAGFAFLGGFGISAGMVTDATGISKPYFTFNGNIGFGVGVSFDVGKTVPTGNNQFLVTDFAGEGASYNVGFSTPALEFNYSKGGSLSPNMRGSDTMLPSNFGKNSGGYKTEGVTFAPGGGFGVGAMFSKGTTWVRH